MLVVIYTKKVCPYCEKAKEILNKINAKITTIEVGEDISPQDFKRNVGLISGKKIETVPQIIINGDYVGGYTELEALNLVNDGVSDESIDLEDLDIEL